MEKQKQEDNKRLKQYYQRQFQSQEQRNLRLKKLDALFDEMIKYYTNQNKKQKEEKYKTLQSQQKIKQKSYSIEEISKQQNPDFSLNFIKKDNAFEKFQFQTIYLSDIKKEYTKIKSVDKKNVKEKDISFLIPGQILKKQQQKLANSFDVLVFPNFDGVINHKRSQINQTLRIIQTMLRKQDQNQGIIDFISLLKYMKFDDHLIKKVYNHITNQTLNIIQLYASDDPQIYRVINVKLKQWKLSSYHLNYLRYPIKKMFWYISINYMRKFIRPQNSIKNSIYYTGGTVYRGTFISENQFQFLKRYENGYIQMLGFLSTTLDKGTAQTFQKNVIFQIKIDSKLNRRTSQFDYGFCDLNQEKIAVFEFQNQILFNIKSIFRVLKAEKIIDQTTNSPKYKILLQYGIQKSINFSYVPKDLTKQQKIALSVEQFSSNMRKWNQFQGYTLIQLFQIQAAKKYIELYQYQQKEKYKQYFYLALIYDKLLDFQKAIIHYKKTINITQAFIKRNKLEKIQKQEDSYWRQYSYEDVVKCLFNISIIYQKEKKWRQFFLVFKDLKQKIILLQEYCQQFYEAEMLRAISNFYRIQNNQQKSKEYFQMSTKIQHNFLGPLDISLNYKLLGRQELNKLNFKSALYYFQHGRQILYEEYGKEHPQVASILKDIGLVNLRLGLYDKALLAFSECLKIQQKCFVDPVTIKSTQLNIGITLSKMARYDQSQQIVRKCHKFFLSKLEPNSRQVKAAQTVLQTVLTKKMYKIPAGSVLVIPK